MLEQDIHHQLEVLVEQPHDLLRRARFAHGGEATDVGEQHGDLGQRATLFEAQLARDHLIHEARRQQALKLDARPGLVLDLARQVGVVNRHRGLAGDAGEDLQVLLDEGVGRDHRVEVHDAEQHVVMQQRDGHGRTNSLHDHGLRAREPTVHGGVGRQHGRLVLDDLVQDRGRQHDLFVLAVPGLGDARLGHAVLHEQDDAAICRDQLEGLHDDLLEQDIEVDLEPDRASELVGQTQLLVVAPQDLDVRDLLLGQKFVRGGRRLEPLADQRLGTRWGDGDLLQERIAPGVGRVLEGGRAQGDLVPFFQDSIGQAFALEEGAVQAAEIAKQEGPVTLANDLGVFLGHDTVQDLHRVVRMPPDGVDRS